MSSLGSIPLDKFDANQTSYSNEYLKIRNDLKTPFYYKGDQMYEEKVKPDPDYVYTVTKDYQKTPLSLTFFSQKNVDYLQKKMAEIVFKETGHKIGNQSVPDLLNIMRSYYLQEGKNLDYDIPRQVAELNLLVLKYACFDQIIPKIKGYNTFLYDNMRTNVVLPRERYISQSGARLNRGTADLI